jgi:hypothetical protein
MSVVVLMGLCLALQARPDKSVFIPATEATLAWTHSIEKIRWEEDLRVEPPVLVDGQPALRVVAARIRGSGSGMEPPDGAVLRDGWYHYMPTLPPRREVALVRSPYVPDFELCVGGGCRPMSHWLPGDGGVTLLSACAASSQPSRR